MEKYLGFVAVTVFLLSCTNTDRDNPFDERADNPIREGSSSSVRHPSSSSSSSVEPSSSSAEPSSSSVIPSSSSLAQSSSSSSSVEPLSGSSGVFTDIRNSKTYKWVKIGTQIWMAENLNYAASGSKCRDGNSLSEINTEYCDAYGRLYNWSTAMNNSASSTENPNGVRGVCPSGWHIPSDAEWEVLMTAVGGSESAGTKLKSKSGWSNYEGASGNGTNDYEFLALPGGYGKSDDSFINGTYYGYWWSTLEYNDSNSRYRYMSYNDSSVRRNYGLKSNLYSVRCVYD